MIEKYIDQSAFGLMLNVVEGTLDKEQFDLRTFVEIKMPEFKIEASIIGASHVISFSNSDLMFHEVFACTDVVTNSRRAYCGPLKSVMGKQDLKFGETINYKFNVSLKTWADGKEKLALYEEKVRANKKKEEKNFVCSEYCFEAGKDGIVPKTIVMVKAYDKLVVIATLHAYPNEMNLVFTETGIELLT